MGNPPTLDRLNFNLGHLPRAQKVRGTETKGQRFTEAAELALPPRISRFAEDLNSFFSTYIHSAAPFFGIALRRDGR
jgi:hypothetical protein